MAIRSMFSTVISMIFLHFKRPIKVKLRFSFSGFKTMLKEGVTLFIGGYGATSLWAVIETTIILKYYGSKDLGLWSMGFMVSEIAVKIPQAINMVLAPKIIHEFGKTNNIKEVQKMIKTPMFIGVPIMVILALI